MSFKKCRVVMLTTNKQARVDDTIYPSQIALFEGKLHLCSSIRYNYLESTFHDLYILSYDPVSPGDLCISPRYDEPIVFGQVENSYEEECAKIIATTNSKLFLESGVVGHSSSGCYDQEADIKIPFPKPSKAFIDKYIDLYNSHGKAIMDVMVEYKDDWDKGTKMCMEGYGDDPEKFPFHPQLKVSLDNIITIKKVKEVWNREEVGDLLDKFRKDFPLHRGVQITDFDLKEWINKNL